MEIVIKVNFLLIGSALVTNAMVSFEDWKNDQDAFTYTFCSMLIFNYLCQARNTLMLDLCPSFNFLLSLLFYLGPVGYFSLIGYGVFFHYGLRDFLNCN